MSRSFYIIAYDISDGYRLNRVRHFLKGYSTGGQKSVFECFLTPAEVREVMQELRQLIEPAEDRVHLFIMDARSRTHTLGVAIQPRDPGFFYFG